MAADPLHEREGRARRRKPPARRTRLAGEPAPLSPYDRAAAACLALRDAQGAAQTVAATVLACDAADEVEGRRRAVKRAESGLFGLNGWDWEDGNGS